MKCGKHLLTHIPKKYTHISTFHAQASNHLHICERTQSFSRILINMDSLFRQNCTTGYTLSVSIFVANSRLRYLLSHPRTRITLIQHEPWRWERRFFGVFPVLFVCFSLNHSIHVFIHTYKVRHTHAISYFLPRKKSFTNSHVIVS